MRKSTVHQVGVDGRDREHVRDRVEWILAVEAHEDEDLPRFCPRRDDDRVFPGVHLV